VVSTAGDWRPWGRRSFLVHYRLRKATGLFTKSWQRNSITQPHPAIHCIALPLIVIAAALLCKTLFAPKVITAQVGGAQVQVELADDQAERAQGLSGRTSLPENSGMLFVFDTPDFYAFWMKDTLVPLDFVWINRGAVVEITENVQPADYQPPRTLSPRQPVDKVLELKAGTVKNLGIKVGDKVTF